MIAVLLALAAALSGCATTTREPWPVERLDPHTAVHSTIMAEPWVFARDAREIAVHARDYLHVGVVQTNRAGQRAFWLGVVAYSTVDRSALPLPPRPARPGRIRLAWPEGTMELSPAPAGRGAIGASEPLFTGPQPPFEEAWYPLSTAQLARLSRQPPLSVTLLDDDAVAKVGEERRYEAWRTKAEPIERFVEVTGLTGDTTR
jgi:hypothetical protein